MAKENSLPRLCSLFCARVINAAMGIRPLRPFSPISRFCKLPHAIASAGFPFSSYCRKRVWSVLSSVSGKIWILAEQFGKTSSVAAVEQLSIKNQGFQQLLCSVIFLFVCFYLLVNLLVSAECCTLSTICYSLSCAVVCTI